jgi:acyl-CoA reductase-like NAD-dependent aldehyde dehydrogenase
MFGSTVHALMRTYGQRARGGDWTPPPARRRRSDGQVVVTVYPSSTLDKMYAPGYRGEIWLQPGGGGGQGACYDPAGGVCAILGAGNYETPIDILRKMFAENRVVVYKPNPVNAASADHLERIFAPLIDAGFLAIVRGDAEVGSALVHHSAVDEVLMTGAAATYDRIVWGPVAEQEANKKAGRKLLDKRFDAELGGAAPVIVVPGAWSDAELEHQAAHIAVCKILNGSHICASPQVLVVDKSWPQRQAFLERMRHHLRTILPDPCYYPGAAEKQARFKSAHPQTESLGASPKVFENQLERLLIPDAKPDALVTKEEAFCPVLAEVALDGGDARALLDQAIPYCNEQLYGSLSATLLVDPRTEKTLGDRLDDAIARLEYGSIGVNTWGGTAVFFAEMPWGAFPKHTPEDIQSGMGWLGNCYMLDGCQKGVFWTPFVSPIHLQPPRPRDLKVLPRMARYSLRPSAGRLLHLMSAALLGV